MLTSGLVRELEKVDDGHQVTLNGTLSILELGDKIDLDSNAIKSAGGECIVYDAGSDEPCFMLVTTLSPAVRQILESSEVTYELEEVDAGSALDW